MAPLLQVEASSKRFGGLLANRDVSLAIEPAAAVALVRRIHEDLNVTICVVEHVMEVVMPLSHRVVVLDYGVKIAEGAPPDVVRDEQVIRAYLGERRAHR